MFHYFAQKIDNIYIPTQFTCPFCYEPHPLSIMAAEEVIKYIDSRIDWHDELKMGKMFGVLVVKNNKNELGFISAYSGNLLGQNNHEYFVPPIYDCQNPNGVFKNKEREITAINKQIESILIDSKYYDIKAEEEQLKNKAQEEIDVAKKLLKQHKQERDEIRKNNIDSDKESELIKQSQFEKAELKRLERRWQNKFESIHILLKEIEDKISYLKGVRKRMSAELQYWLFEQFEILNANGEKQTINEIFANQGNIVPPGGTGECAAPKMLQYAYKNDLTPISMAEFWWGASPIGEIRHHGFYYPACHNKCEYLLNFMLKGLNVEPNRLKQNCDKMLEILYEDDWIIAVNKPEGLLSVPGKESTDSVYYRIKQMYPNTTGPIIVHRLDMATSGVLLLAKTKEIHAALQQQFENREINKKYIALVNGCPKEKSGIIDLPIRLNPNDRPRQMVDFENGKTAITKYNVIETHDGFSRVEFYPMTGRTHQLRIHAAHPLGLNCYIIGDTLYGKNSERLYLHAEIIQFAHPIYKKPITIEAKCKF